MQGGQVLPPVFMEFQLNRASEARQAVGMPPVGKCSGGVGMWSTCRVVHHVHAVGALVHQAEQAGPLLFRASLWPFFRHTCASKNVSRETFNDTLMHG